MTMNNKSQSFHKKRKELHHHLGDVSSFFAFLILFYWILPLVEILLNLPIYQVSLA